MVVGIFEAEVRYGDYFGVLATISRRYNHARRLLSSALGRVFSATGNSATPPTPTLTQHAFVACTPSLDRHVQP